MNLRDPVALADGIEKRDKPLRQKTARAAIAHLQANFTLEKSVKENPRKYTTRSKVIKLSN
jgi:hypothetical protein